MFDILKLLYSNNPVNYHASVYYPNLISHTNTKYNFESPKLALHHKQSSVQSQCL